MANDNNLNGSVGLDTTNFKNGVTDLNNQIKAIETGFRASATVMGNWSETSAGLTTRTTSLSDKLDIQKQKLSIMRDQFMNLSTAEGDNTHAMDILANQMNSAERQISSTQSELNRYNEQLRTTTQQESESTNSISKLKASFLGLSDQSNKSTSLISSGFSNLKNIITGFAVTAIAGFSLKSVVDEMNSEEKATAQMGAVLKSTGDASGMTSKQLTDLADAQSKVTTNSKDTTESAENMLLTFTNIKSNVFPQTIKTAEDMATALGTSASDAAKTLGKALNDPATGLSKFTRLGVTFTAAQKEQITSMEKAGDTAGAQGIILDTLSQKFGGSATAASTTFAGSIQIMTNGLKESGASILTSLMPIVTNLMPSLVSGVQGIASEITAHKSEIVEVISAITGAIKDVVGFVENHGPLIKGVIVSVVGAMVLWKAATLASTAAMEISNAITVISAIATGGLAAGTEALTAVEGSSTLAKIAQSAATVGSTAAFLAHGVALGATSAATAIATAEDWLLDSATWAQIGSTIAGTTAFIAHGIALGALAVAHGIATVATGVATAAQWLFNAALNANPIGLIILGIAALIAATVLIATHWKQVSAVLLGVWSDIKEGFSDVVNFVIDGLNLWLKGFLMPFNLIIKGIDLLPGVKIPQLTLAIPNIPKFDIGSNYIPQDMLAMVHKGEMIVPKNQNPYANSSAHPTNNYNSYGPAQQVTQLIVDGQTISNVIQPRTSRGLGYQSGVVKRGLGIA